jgi:hypothetical protein
MIKNKTLIEEITLQCVKEREHALKYRQRREPKWRKTDDLYYGNKQKSLVSRANVHLPILHGAVETLLAKIDGAPNTFFRPQASADKPKAVFLGRSLELDANMNAWDAIDHYSKSEAIKYGRSQEKKYATREKGKFKDVRELVLCIDYLIDPLAGGLKPYQKAKFMGQDNIIRTEYELDDKELYNQEAVKRVLTTIQGDMRADSRNNSHSYRKYAQGLDRFAYVSDDAVNLTEWFTTYKGKRYYVLFSPTAQTAIRVELLKDMTSSDEFPYSGWAAFADPEEYWSPAPAELFHDTNYVQNILVSQLLDNSAQRNYGMKAYDMTKITSPQYLDPKPMGRIPVNGNPNDAIMDITFPSIGENLQLLTWLNAKNDSDTGVTQNARGVPNSKRMSAAEFNGLIEQVADRIYTHNRLYRFHYERVCRLYAYGVWEFMTEDRRIEVEGAMGVNNVFKNGDSLRFNSDFLVEVQLEKEQERDQTAQAQLVYIEKARQNPRLNQAFLDAKEAELLNFTEDEVKRLTTPLPDSDWRSFAEAQEENEELIKSKVDPNEAATFSHVQAHLDFVRYSKDLTDQQRKRILEHSGAEMQIAQRNAQLAVSRVLQQQNAQQMAPTPQPQPQPVPQV